MESSFPAGDHLILNKLFYICLRHSESHKVLGIKLKPHLPESIDGIDNSKQNVSFYRAYFPVVETRIKNESQVEKQSG
jgi:hypothetical protein